LSKKSTTTYKITSSTFINSYAEAGGAIYISNPREISIYDNVFTSNKVVGTTDSGQGGAVFYTCSGTNCSLSLYDNNFSNNSAENAGGAVYWD
jgi:hypothetical protein